MKLTLYYAPNTCATVPYITLTEARADFDVRNINTRNGQNRSPEFLRLNPRGAIPVVVDDNGPGGQRLVLAQSHAIVVHYAMQENKFIPADPIGRALCFQWISHVASDAAPTSGALFAVQNFIPEKSEANTQFFVDRGQAPLQLAPRAGSQFGVASRLPAAYTESLFDWLGALFDEYGIGLLGGY